jgi:hypothetical protein
LKKEDKMKKRLIFLIVAFALLTIASQCPAGGYFQYSTTNGRTTHHTYVDNRTGATYGGNSTQYGNTTHHNMPGYSGYSITTGNITMHTYIDRQTGAVTGGSSWRYGNTTYHYGSSPPHPYN